MDELYFLSVIAFVVALIVLVFLFVSGVTAPCHGSVFSPNREGRFCPECGEAIYHLCECGHKLHGNYCTYCGAENEFLED